MTSVMAATGSSTRCAGSTARPCGPFTQPEPLKGAIAYDRGRLFFGAYDGRLYALKASDGKLLWRAQSERDLFGGHGQFYSTPCVAYSRSISARPTVTSTGSASRAESCAGRPRPAASYTLCRPSGTTASSSARTTTTSTPSTPRRARFSGSSARTARSPARRPSSTGVVYFSTLEAAHLRARRPDREAGVDVSRRRVHTRGDRRAPDLRRRLGEGVRLQSRVNRLQAARFRAIDRRWHETIEIGLDGKVVGVPRDVVSELAAAAAARAGVSERHRDLSLRLNRALESGRVSLGRGEMRALVAVLEEEHAGPLRPRGRRAAAAPWLAA